MKIICDCGKEPAFVDHADVSREHGEERTWMKFECPLSTGGCGATFDVTITTPLDDDDEEEDDA